MGWDDVGFAVSGKHRLRILKILQNAPLTPSQISRRTNLHMSQITRSLKELQDRDLVKCLNPELKKGRLFSLTKKGSEISKMYKIE
ncbi:MAG: helix-turn-helix domain-containing protein [Nitrosopumilus sp.]|nr:helix-turn-helix domain-containing protein [Nitrosopumilus sp.]MDA7944970.1 helix-turn-helix domain-containing protein [Nitrosopumilus sp.]MDA7973777.1 helix-turn-helix domain-containing protein [Nitrosopumilus sp.]